MPVRCNARPGSCLVASSYESPLLGWWSGASVERLGVPPWSLLFFVKKITAISSLLPLEFWCSEGHFAQFDLILTLFWATLTCFDLFRRADLTYFHIFRPIRRADLTYFHLFRPISFHNKAPWTGHLRKGIRPRQGTEIVFDHDKGQKSAISGRGLHWILNYHPCQNHYTHEIIIFELLRGLQLQLSGVVRIN